LLFGVSLFFFLIKRTKNQGCISFLTPEQPPYPDQIETRFAQTADLIFSDLAAARAKRYKAGGGARRFLCMERLFFGKACFLGVSLFFFLIKRTKNQGCISFLTPEQPPYPDQIETRFAQTADLIFSDLAAARAKRYKAGGGARRFLCMERLFFGKACFLGFLCSFS
jgi:hypothetical protein